MGKKSVPTKSYVTLETYKKQALEAMEKLEYEESVRLLKLALKLKPDSTELLDLLGKLTLLNISGTNLMNIGQPETAKIVFTKSVSISPNIGFQKYMYLGQISNGKEAFDYLKKGIQILLNMRTNFDNTLTKEEHLNALCEAYCSVVELFMTDLCFEEDAEKICEDFVSRAQKEDKDGTNINVLQTTANLRLVQKNVKEAKNCLKQIVDLYQKGSQVTYEYKLSTCKILIETEEFGCAQEILQGLCEELETVDTWYLLGLTFKYQKEFSSAVEHFKKALLLGIEEKEDKEFLKEIQKEIDFCGKQKDEVKIEKDEKEEDDEDELEILSEDEDIMEEIKKE